MRNKQVHVYIHNNTAHDRRQNYFHPNTTIGNTLTARCCHVIMCQLWQAVFHSLPANG